MVEYKINKNGYVEALISWVICDKFRIPTASGEYCYVDNFWKHESLNFKETLREFIKIMKWKAVNNKVKYVYWNRKKYDTSRTNSAVRMRPIEIAERI